MGLVVAGPLDAAELVDALVGHAGVHGRKAAALVPHLLGGWGSPVGAETSSDFGDDLDVVACAGRRLERTTDALHSALAVGDGALRLSPAGGGGQHNVSELSGLRQEDVLDHEVIEPAEQSNRAGLVGLGSGRVLADDVNRLELAVLHRLEHLAEVIAALGWDGMLPSRLEAASYNGILNVLEAGQLVGDRAHVAPTLDVVLAAKRVEPAAVAADLAGEQGEVDERQNVVRGVVVLGDAKRPADHRPVSASERVSDFLDCGR